MKGLRMGHRGAMAAAMLAASAGLWFASPAVAQVSWRSGPADQPHFVGRAELTTKLQRLAPTQGVHRVLVRLDQIPTDAEKASLASQGLKLLSYVGDNAYFASLSARGSMDIKGIAASGRVFNAEVIERDWKLHPDLAKGLVREWTVVDPGTVDENASAEERAKRDPVVAVYVMLHQDANLENMAAKIVAEYQGFIRSRLTTINTLVVEMPASQIKMLADVDDIQWMEPPLPALSELNLENRPTVQADLVEAAPYNITGAGVRVMEYDGGRVRNTHVEFGGRVVYGADAADALSDHSTHVAGTICGSGNGGAGERGMAPGVSALISYAFEVPGGLQQGFLYTDPGDLQSDYNEAINTLNADMSNNSIGTNTESNGYPCEWQGQYGITDALIDSIARGSLGQPFPIFWAAGNERQGTRCNTEGFGSYYSVAPPSGAKNHMSIGATNSWESTLAPGATADTMTTFSSWGPVDDGRLKPDFCAPGCQAAGGETGVRSAGSASDTTYSVKCGTSMATPTATGVGALILQDFRAQYPSEPDLRGSTMKVFLAHTAIDLGNPGPDYQFGYGRIRAKNAIDFLRTGNFAEGSVTSGGSSLVTVVVAPGDPELRVTLAWDDAPGVPNSAVNLVNDLDLVVTAPGGQRFYPWTLNPAVPTANAVQTAENHRDNLEQVLVANPTPGAWLVEIRGTAVPQGPQSYSIAASPFLVNCSDAGVVALGGEKFNCGSLATFKVVDCGLNTDDGVIDTVTVHVSSTSDAGFDAVLSESAPEAATFVGSVQLSTTPGGGNLLVADGDTVTVTYVDADNGSGGTNVTVTDTAPVDCAGPIITNVAVSGVTYNTATVSFTTNEPTQASVRYGTSCGTFGTPVVDNAFSTTHTIALSGLANGTLHRFVVDATDSVGNSSTNDNGADCFSFTTLDIPDDYFTQLFTATGPVDPNDMDNRQITFSPNGSAEFYEVCEDTVFSLPIDATGHATVAVGNDTAPVQLTLTGGQTVKIYGRSYGSFWVNPSGNISFTASDTTVTETISAHFNRDRLSVLFDDIDSTLAGASVKWAQLADRAVVTWTNVPEDGGLNPSTFQCEMFFDGRIRYSYLTISQLDGLIGISGGQGVGQTGGTPVGFVESDISSYGSCGPRPPSALGATAQTPVNQPVTVTLTSYDDGLPAPSSLLYRVVSLPAQGTLSDPSFGIITGGSLPFALSGNTVNYSPPNFFQGQVTFGYTVDDGGTPPDGGVSNTGTATVVVGGPQVVYEFLVDDTNPGWTTMGQWAFGHPTGGQGTAANSFDPTNGFTGVNVYGYNLAGAYPNSLTPIQYLTSTAIDCTNKTQISVEFRRWLGVESATFDHANLQFSVDNVNWITLYNHTAGSFSEQTWTLQSYSLSPQADNQPTVYLRWGMGTTDTSVTYQGWNIDDIRIKALVPIVPPDECAGDSNGDNVVDAADLSVLLANFGLPAAGPAFGDFNGDGQCNGADLSVLLGAFGVPCV